MYASPNFNLSLHSPGQPVPGRLRRKPVRFLIIRLSAETFFTIDGIDLAHDQLSVCQIDHPGNQRQSPFLLGSWPAGLIPGLTGNDRVVGAPQKQGKTPGNMWFPFAGDP